MKEALTQELQLETQELRAKLDAVESKARSNASAADILTQFINEGHAELDDSGQVRLVPNTIRNEEFRI